MECNVHECAFQDCLDKMVNDGDLKNKILNDVQKYKRQEDRFGRKMTIDRIDHLQPCIVLKSNIYCCFIISFYTIILICSEMVG